MSGFLTNGTNIDTLFAARGSTAKIADVGIRTAGTDISNNFMDIALGYGIGVNTNIKSNGTDISQLFSSVTGRELWIWGFFNNGASGTNVVSVTLSSPVQVGTSAVWKDVSGQAGATAGITTSGALWTWGGATAGQLGLNSATVSRSSPVQVGALTNWKQVSHSNLGFMMAVKTDGTLWAWGISSGGVLGLNSATVSRSSPVQVGALTNWRNVYAGQSSTFAIKNDSTLWSWGFGENALFNGVLGIGIQQAYRSSPVQVGALTNWSKASTGISHALFVKTNGTMWAVGGGGNTGAIGLNDVIRRSSPVQIGALTTWASVKASGRVARFFNPQSPQLTLGAVNVSHSNAITTGGTLWSWGEGRYGQLGLNNIVSRSSPVQVGALTSWRHLSTNLSVFASQPWAGSVPASTYRTSTLVISNNNSLWAFGSGWFGTLGLNNIVNQSSPVQVGALTNWRTLSGGVYASIARKG